MFGQISEKQMHRARWMITMAWLLLIASLLYDPLSPWLTGAASPLPVLRVDPAVCIQVQGDCIDTPSSYYLGATVFWGAIVPSAIFILLIFGHELWRRICPLAFLSQIPRALGWQRQFKRVNEKTGKIRYELAKVKADSWLGRNALYLQFGILYVGLCARILLINGDRLALFLWFGLTIAAAITVGYLYGGKSWCNYFCPMSPVQRIYAEPAGLLASAAHIGDQQITQSMCRTIVDGKEQSACVACQNPCIDIDAERSYWDGLLRPERKFLTYAYVGLVVGYFSYYYLYAGNWHYYFSGAWARQSNQWVTLLSPGFYLAGTVIAIPKVLAVPLTLAAFTALGCGLGNWAEKQYRAYMQRKKRPLSAEVIQHRIVTLCTFAVFNFFFIFGGRPLILLLPFPLQFFYEAILVGLSTLWFYRTWQRNPDRYGRESLASRLRRQLNRLELNLAQYIEGRSLDDLSTDEVYVLAKVLPGFTREKRHQAYKGVLREALEEGYVNSSSSLEVLRQIREELHISEDEHRLVLEELGVEDPTLLDPSRQRSRENLVRLTGYRKAMERMLAIQQRQIRASQELLENETAALRALRREYSVTLQEELEILDNLEPNAQMLRRAEFLRNQLQGLIQCNHALNQPLFKDQSLVLNLLRQTVQQKEKVLLTGLLDIIAQLIQNSAQGEEADRRVSLAMQLARSLEDLAPVILSEMLEQTYWQNCLSPEILRILQQPGDIAPACSLEVQPSEIVHRLDALFADPNPLIQAVSLYLINQVAPEQGQLRAKSLLNLKLKPHTLVLEVAQTIVQLAPQPPLPLGEMLSAFSGVEKLVSLCNTDFFGEVHSETLMELSQRSLIKVYQAGDIITEEGDTCRELLLLLQGNVTIERHRSSGEIVRESLRPGYVLDELEVLSHGVITGTITAEASPTRLLTLPVDALDDLLDRDHDFARRILELESRRLQQLIHQ